MRSLFLHLAAFLGVIAGSLFSVPAFGASAEPFSPPPLLLADSSAQPSEEVPKAPDDAIMSGPSQDQGTAIPPSAVVFDPRRSQPGGRLAFFMDRPSEALGVLFTPAVLDWAARRDASAAMLFKAFTGAKVRSLTVQSNMGKDDILVCLELPEAKLEAIAGGQINRQSLAEALGADLADFVFSTLGADGDLPISANVQPGVHQLDRDLFMGVQGANLLFATSPLLVNMGGKKLQSAKSLVDLPEPKPQIWLRSDLAVHIQPAGQEGFVSKNLQSVLNVQRTEDSWAYASKSNISDILPAMGSLEPIDFTAIPLFSDSMPLLSVALSGSILKALDTIYIKGLDKSLMSEALDGMPLAQGVLEQAALVLGGIKADLLGMEAPGVEVVFNLREDAATAMYDMLKEGIPAQWQEKSAEGWDSVSASDTVTPGGAPIPASMLLARKGGTLVVGLMRFESLSTPADGRALASQEQLASGVYNIDFQGLWQEIRRLVGNGTVLRKMSRVDAAIGAELVDDLLSREFPVTALVLHQGTDAGKVEGHLRETAGETGFLPALLPILDKVFPAQ